MKYTTHYKFHVMSISSVTYS